MFQREYDIANIVEGSFGLTLESRDVVYSEFEVWFGASPQGGESETDFASMTYATPKATTAPDGIALTSLCAIAEQVLGQARLKQVFAEFIPDLATANLLLSTLVLRYTARHQLVEFRTWLDAAPVQVGDYILLTHPVLLAETLPVLAEVTGKTIDCAKMQVGIIARVLLTAAWHEPWEWTLAPTGDTTQYDEGWEE